MAKLTKDQAKRHAEAVALLAKDVLTEDERTFVLDNWQESARHINSIAGAFFTPTELADHLAIDVGSGRIIDLCAGVGALSLAVLRYTARWPNRPEIVCVELNPDYVEVGRKVVPEATWICGDVLDIPAMDLGRFDTAISNPPFGRIKRDAGKGAPRYKGGDFEFHVMDVAAHVAERGVFILPQASAGFRYSSHHCFERHTSGRAVDFQRLTKMRFDAGCGVDTSFAKDLWRGASPVVEIVCVDFLEEAAAEQEVATQPEAAAPAAPQGDLFGRAA